MRFREIRPLTEANIVNPKDIDTWLTRLLKLWLRRMPRDPAIPAWLIRRVRQYLTGLPTPEADKLMSQVPNDDMTLPLLATTYGDWVQDAHARGEPLFWFGTKEGIYPRVLHVLQYLTSLNKVSTDPQEHETALQTDATRQIQKITRLTLEQAEAHADQWFARLQAASQEHAERADATGTKLVIDFHDGFRWVEITDSRALDREGSIMQHCVGGGSYDEDLAAGKVRIFSLRDKRNQPHVTVEANSKLAWDAPHDWNTESDDGEWKIEQIKGKQNQGPSTKYARYVAPLLNGLNYPMSEEGIRDIESTGLYRKYRKDGQPDGDWGTLSQVGTLVGDAGPCQVYIAGPNQISVFVAQNDKPLVQFILRDDRRTCNYALSMYDEPPQPSDLRAAIQVLLDAGYGFTGGCSHYLAMSQIVVQGDRAILASELPMVTEVQGYRATVLRDEKQEQILLWLIRAGEIAAYIILWTTPKVRQVDHIALIEQPSLPLAEAIADAFTALKVNGLTTAEVQKELARVVHRPGLGFPWEPVARLRRQGDAP